MQELLTKRAGKRYCLTVGTGKIPNAQIPTTFKEAAVVNDIAARDELSPFQGSTLW